MLVAGLALTGCGEQADETAADPTSPAASEPAETGSTGETTAPAGTPACAETWQAGNRIPRSYKGCEDDEGSFVERDLLDCSSGQRMVRYADRFYGVLGGAVREASGPLDDDRDYRAAVRSCRA